MKILVQLIAVVFWLAGIVLSNGFWSCFFSIIFPLYSWYLCVEKAMLVWRVI